MDVGGEQIKVSKQNFSENLGNFDNFGGLPKGIWQLREGGVVNFPLSRRERGKLFITLFYMWVPKPILSPTFKIIKANGG